MFDIGWSELLILVVVAVVVVGPKDLPRMMRTVGQWVGRARAMADQFKRSFDDMARQAELEELRAEVMKLHNEKSIAEINRETEIMLGNIPADPLTPILADIRNVESDPLLAANAEAAAQPNLPGVDTPQAPPAREEP